MSPVPLLLAAAVLATQPDTQLDAPAGARAALRDSLARAYRDAQVAMDRATRNEWQENLAVALGHGTVRFEIGGVSVLTAPRRRREVEAGLTAFTDAVRERLGRRAGPTVLADVLGTRHLAVLPWHNPLLGLRGRFGPPGVVVSYDSIPDRPSDVTQLAKKPSLVLAKRGGSIEGILDRLGRTAEAGVLADADPALRAWLGDALPLLVAGIARDDLLDDALVRGGADDRHCLTGRLDACRDALRRSVDSAGLHVSARQHLAARAIVLGGAGSIERLLADPTAPIADRLVAASGVTDSALVADWMASMPSRRNPWSVASLVVLALGIGASVTFGTRRAG